MFAKHVEAKVLQHLQIIFHSLAIGWRVQAVRPVALVESSELEYKLAIQQRALNAIDLSTANSAESRVAGDNVVPESYADIVQCRRVGTPQFAISGVEGKSSV